MKVAISLKSAEILAGWLKDLNKALHMIPNGNEYIAFVELQGAIQDTHYQEKQGVEYGEKESDSHEHCHCYLEPGD